MLHNLNYKAYIRFSEIKFYFIFEKLIHALYLIIWYLNLVPLLTLEQLNSFLFIFIKKGPVKSVENVVLTFWSEDLFYVVGYYIIYIKYVAQSIGRENFVVGQTMNCGCRAETMDTKRETAAFAILNDMKFIKSTSSLLYIVLTLKWMFEC